MKTIKQKHQLLLCISLTLLHSERPKLCTILAFLSAVGLFLLQYSCDIVNPIALRKAKIANNLAF